MNSTRVKICGITSVEDALAAQSAGADAIGLVFYERSKRAVSIDQAAAIARAVGPFVTTVGLFVNANPAFIDQALSKVALQLMQFHGDEPPDECRRYGRPYIKALRMRDAIDLEREAARYADARGLLLDAYRPGVPGGTGETFDWARVPRSLDLPLVLAGGLTPANVARARDATGVGAVDVSGGVEAAPGRKDPALVKEFIANARTGPTEK